MRAHVKRGIPAWELQGRRNDWYSSRVQFNERGWPIPFSVQDGWARLTSAAWHRLYRLTILGKHLSPYERADHLRRWRINIEEARGCARPRLP